MPAYVKDGVVTYHIQRIDVLSLAKMLAALHAMIGLVIGFLITMISFLGPEGSDRVLFGPLAIIFLPLINFILGFIGGALVAGCYNLSVSFLGGIKIHLSED
jgi:hypothetical protein